MQPFVHLPFSSAPFSVFLHITATDKGSDSIEIKLIGHIGIQTEQPLHLRGLMRASPLSTHMASLGQTFTQSPKPKHPNVHDPWPP